MIRRFVSTAFVAGCLAAASNAQMTPTIVKRQLGNGLRVWIVEQHELPVVQMSLVVGAGTDADPPGQEGVASLTSTMLTAGAGSRSGVEIADALDGLLANLSGSSSIDSSSLQLYVPVAGFVEALPLMADAAARPTFPKQALDAMRQQRLVTLRNARSDPDAIAAVAFARSVYGSSAPGVRGPIGTADSLNALTPAALRAFHESAYQPSNSTLIVVGDVASDRVLPLVDTYFGKWPKGSANAAVREPALVVQTVHRQLILVDMPGAPQSRIVIGSAAASKSMSDFFPIQVLSTVMRARLSSDRNPPLRDYTSSVRSGFDIRKSTTQFVVAAAAQADRTGESVRALVAEVSRMLKGTPADEIERAKEEIAVTFPKTFEATGRISTRLRALEALVVYGLPDDYYANYVPAIRAVRPADVERVAKQYMDPDHLTIVIVGDRKTIAPSIEALKLGSITDVSADEVFAPAK
jgi:zinc protease